MIKRTVGDITIERDGDGLAIQWSLVGSAGTFGFAATPDGALPLTTAGLTQAGVDAAQREAVIGGVWDFTPMEVRSITLDGAAVRTR
jgi:Na+/H+-dicarboxylate symporter